MMIILHETALQFSSRWINSMQQLLALGLHARYISTGGWPPRRTETIRLIWAYIQFSFFDLSHVSHHCLIAGRLRRAFLMPAREYASFLRWMVRFIIIKQKWWRKRLHYSNMRFFFWWVYVKMAGQLNFASIVVLLVVGIYIQIAWCRFLATIGHNIFFGRY